MSEFEHKRVRRSPQELAEAADVQIQELEELIPELEERKQAAINEFDRKIDKLYNRIEKLQERKKALLGPKPARKPRKTKKQKIEELLKKAQKAGMKPEQIAEALGVDLA